MKIKPVQIILLLAFFGFTAGLIYHNSMNDHSFATVNVQIIKDSDNTWRVKDNNGQRKGMLKAKKRDKINWHAKGSDMVFKFPENMKDYFIIEEGMFANGSTQRVERNKKLRLEIKRDAPSDTLVYQVYVIDAEDFVIGNSPPVLIIQ